MVTINIKALIRVVIAVHWGLAPLFPIVTSFKQTGRGLRFLPLFFEDSF